MPGAQRGVVRGRELLPVVPIGVSRSVAARLPRATLHKFPNDLHDVLNEHDRDAVHEVVADFVTSSVALTAVER